MGIIYSKCHNGVIRETGFADVGTGVCETRKLVGRPGSVGSGSERGCQGSVIRGRGRSSIGTEPRPTNLRSARMSAAARREAGTAGWSSTSSR
jgi:hypothetical protein